MADSYPYKNLVEAVPGLVEDANKFHEVLQGPSGSFVQVGTESIPTIRTIASQLNQRYTAYNVKGAWATATSYVTNDVVAYSGDNYLCVSNHTSTGAFDSTKWVSFGANFGEFGLGTVAAVVNDGKVVRSTGFYSGVGGTNFPVGAGYEFRPFIAVKQTNNDYYYQLHFGGLNPAPFPPTLLLRGTTDGGATWLDQRFAPISDQTTWNVPEDYPTIQAAINDISNTPVFSHSGNLVVSVADGTYSNLDDISITNDSPHMDRVVLWGRSDNHDACILEFDSGASGLYSRGVNHPANFLKGITLKRSAASAASEPDWRSLTLDYGSVWSSYTQGTAAAHLKLDRVLVNDGAKLTHRELHLVTDSTAKIQVSLSGVCTIYDLATSGAIDMRISVDKGAKLFIDGLVGSSSFNSLSYYVAETGEFTIAYGNVGTLIAGSHAARKAPVTFMYCEVSMPTSGQVVQYGDELLFYGCVINTDSGNLSYPVVPTQGGRVTYNYCQVTGTGKLCDAQVSGSAQIIQHSLSAIDTTVNNVAASNGGIVVQDGVIRAGSLPS